MSTSLTLDNIRSVVRAENERLKHFENALIAEQEENERLRAEVERLREYTDHSVRCDLRRPALEFLNPIRTGCDCGYDALMEELEESK